MESACVPVVKTGSWRKDLESLSFQPEGHEGLCVIHRRALGTLLGFSAEGADCERYFAAHRAAFQHAAAAKIKRARLAAQENFHLTSRDIARALRALS